MRIILICLTLGVFDNTYGQNSIFLIKDINQGSGSSDPKKFTPVGENVFFVANESEVWRTDGTEEGTFLIKDTLNNEISFGRFGKSLTVMNGEVYFVVDNNSLWKSDGSENGLVRIGGFSSQSNQIQDVGNTILVSTDTHVFFKMNDTELWAVESGESTAELVRDFNSMFNPFSFGPIEMVEYKGRVIFGASDADTEIVIDHEPYISDGTLSGTFKLKDVFQNSGDANGQGSSPSNFSVVGESVYFTAGERGNSKPSLHISDGTEVGTSSLKLLDGQILGNFSEFDDQLIFTQNGNQIWKSTGTSIGTEFVKTVGTGVSSSSITSGSVLPSENMFYFFANLGAELWKSDGSSDGTFLIESFADNPRLMQSLLKTSVCYLQ